MCLERCLLFWNLWGLLYPSKNNCSFSPLSRYSVSLIPSVPCPHLLSLRAAIATESWRIHSADAWICSCLWSRWGFFSGSAGEESACNTRDIGDADLIPGLGRSPGGGYGNPLQYSCLENPMDRRAWWATVHRASKSRTQLSTYTVGADTQQPVTWGLSGHTTHRWISSPTSETLCRDGVNTALPPSALAFSSPTL